MRQRAGADAPVVDAAAGFQLNQGSGHDMNGRIYAINRAKGILAIETELHGFTIVELQTPCDAQLGDEIDWSSDLEVGPQIYSNLSTKRSLEVRVVSHLVSRSSVRQHMAM